MANLHVDPYCITSGPLGQDELPTGLYQEGLRLRLSRNDLIVGFIEHRAFESDEEGE